MALAMRCNFELSLGTYHLPAFPVPADATLDSWIRSSARDGLERRLQKQPMAAGHDSAKIGRASCRERGSVRVELGGRRYIKKKKKINHITQQVATTIPI